MSGHEENGGDRPLLGIGTEPRTLGLVIGVFVLVIGLPALLFVLAGRTDVAIGLVVIFVLMVVATGYAFRQAVDAERADRSGDGLDE